MKSLSPWTVRLTLVTTTIVVLSVANRLAHSADTPAPKPDSATASDASEAIVATKPATGSLPANYKPSASLADIVRLAQSGVSEEVLLSYINRSNTAFNPTPEDIIFLNDLGVTES